jgi:hypothetical protein
MEALRQSAEAGGGTRAAKPKREADKTAGAKLKTAKRRKAA